MPEDVSSELCRAAASSACQHVVAAPFLLQNMRQADLVASSPSPLKPAEVVISGAPFTASVALDASFRVIVRETVQHNLECSRCSQRGYLCEHSKLALQSADEKARSRLRASIESANGTETFRKARKPASPASLQADKQADGGQSVRWPLQLKPEPGTVFSPESCAVHTDRSVLSTANANISSPSTRYCVLERSL